MGVSCNDSPMTIGADFFQDGTLDVQYVDSLTVNVSTVGFDSLVTSDATRFLVGYHEDPDVGKLILSSVFQVAPDAALSLDPDLTAYSRTTIALLPDGYSCYDTSTQMSLSVHEVTQEMQLDNGYLYSTSSFSYQEEPLGRLHFLPKPNVGDTLEVPLADSFGSTIFSMAQREAEEVSSPDAFMKKFKGIAIIPDTLTSGAILGYGTSPELRIYYWVKTQTPSKERYLTVKGGSHIKYNRIIQDRKNTPLSLIESQQKSLSSELTNHVGFIQAGTGLALRVEIPYLKTILLENSQLTLTDAVLEIRPLQKNEKNTALPASFTVSAVNYRNDFYQTQSLQAYLIEDEYLGRDTWYEVDIRNFVMQQLAVETLNGDALILYLDGQTYRESVDMVRISDQKGEKKIKLKLYCVVLKN